MGKIALRTYNQEIEALVDQNQIDQAISHCRYLLKLYPKYVDTYRVLGKAYLEARRYGESNDVFQRVLSTVPDDFVSHIGMSIIREDEGNMDAAIWHMERAFEVQPSNSIVQEELKRLFGRRDGMQPPKIRLTNGALVRMYYRGELYQQALAELRTTLAEDDQRVDLEIIQAKILYQQGQRSDAAEICTKILKNLPFCLEANRIMYAILMDESRGEEALTYHQRVISLDPYTVALSEGQASTSDVPDDALMVDKLELAPSTERSERPAWMETARVDLSAEDTVLPEWMDESPKVEEPIEPIGEDNVDEKFDEPEMGSTDISGERSYVIEPESDQLPGDESNGVIDTDETLSDETTIPGEVPDWLRSFEPETMTDQMPPSDETDEKLDDLADILASTPLEQDTTEEGELADANATATQPEPVADASDELSTTEESNGDDLEEMIPSLSDELPEWLRELPGIDEIEPGDQNAVPDWLQVEEDAVQSIGAGDGAEMELSDVPEHREYIEPEIEDAAAKLHKDQSEVTSIGSSEAQRIAESPESAVPDVSTSPSYESILEIDGESLDGDAAFAWLETLAAKQGADEDTLLTASEDAENASPEWSAESPQEISQEESSEPENGITLDEPINTSAETAGIPEDEVISDDNPIPVEGGFFGEAVEEAMEKPIDEPEKLPQALKSTETDLEDSNKETGEGKHELPDWLKDLETDAASMNVVADIEQGEEPTGEMAVEAAEDNVAEATSPGGAPELEDLQPDEPREPVIIDSEPVKPIDESNAEEETESDSQIDNARQAMEEQNILLSLEAYRDMIDHDSQLEEVVSDLKNALDRHPVDIDLWQTLGDAYAKIGDLQSAIDCYTKAEELIK